MDTLRGTEYDNHIELYANMKWRLRARKPVNGRCHCIFGKIGFICFIIWSPLSSLFHLLNLCWYFIEGSSSEYHFEFQNTLLLPCLKLHIYNGHVMFCRTPTLCMSMRHLSDIWGWPLNVWTMPGDMYVDCMHFRWLVRVGKTSDYPLIH